MKPFAVLLIGEEAEWRYGEIFRLLTTQGRMIGSSDLWIAAVCLAREVALVTANQEHFGRVPGLRSLTYR